MAHRLYGRVLGMAAVTLCLPGALITIGTPAQAESKDLRIAFINGFTAPQDVFTVAVAKGRGHGGNNGAPPEQVTDVGQVLQMRWSPAGNLFAIAPDFGTVVVMEPDGSNAEVVATGDASLGEFSPDGRQLALVRDSGDTSDIWSVDLASGDLTPIVEFEVTGFTSHVVWSPDGNQLAFDRTDCPAPGPSGCGEPEVVVIGADGAGRRTVAEGTDPSWSPHGRQLAFSGLLDEVRVVSAAGGPARTIATRTLGAPTVVAWQPKGKAIAYFTGEQNPLEDTFSIATVRSDGKKSDSMRLEGFSAIDLSWSPDGKLLAFGSSYETPDGFAFDVFTVSKDLDGLRNVTNTGVAFGAEWAPPPRGHAG
jgi:Tol biopolymer transport system component